MMTIKIKIQSLTELRRLAQALEKSLGGSKTVIALTGELGAGKTTFAKFFLRAAGIKKRITSPTFVLMHQYKKSGKNYFHLDLYRTKNFREIEALGITEAWHHSKNIFLIEWAEKIQRHLPKTAVQIKFKVRPNHRDLQILNLPPKIAKILSPLYN